MPQDDIKSNGRPTLNIRVAALDEDYVLS